MARDYFPKVREAREALREKALELYELHLAIINKAIEAGELEVAKDATQWLIEHMPAGNDGERMIDSSAATPKQIEGRQGPQIQFNVALGGMKPRVALPEVIDITPIDPKKDTQE
jgi:hypothetical protein